MRNETYHFSFAPRQDLNPPASSKGLARKPLSYGCRQGPLKLGNKAARAMQCWDRRHFRLPLVATLTTLTSPIFPHTASSFAKKSKIEGDRAPASGWCHVAILLLEPSSWNKFRDLLLFLLPSSCVGTHSKGKWRGHNFISPGFLPFNAFATRLLPQNL